MKTQVILSLVGSDRPGLTQAVAEAVLNAGGNWLESHLSRLAGKYVGSVLVELDGASLQSLYAAVAAVDAAGLRVVIVPSGADTPLSGNTLHLEVVGNDRRGIVHEVTAALADLDVNVEDLSTRLENSSWSGGRLFRMSGRITIPEGISVDVVRGGLEDLSGEIMVDLTASSEEAAPGSDPA
jgi:glycine cleavage system regulatory protein